MSADPVLSVVVALISGRAQDLERCLAALHGQDNPPPHEVIVPYDPTASAVAELASRYPLVRFLEAEHMDTAEARQGLSREHHDTLRTLGIKVARGRIIALTEDHAVPSPTWCAEMVRLIDEHPQVAAIGGAVECGSDSLLKRAVYYCDFGRYQNPLPEGPAVYVSDSNVAYRREALEGVRGFWEDDYHETVVHSALVEAGHELWLTPRSQVAQVREGLRPGKALRERYVWGRSFAGTRFRDRAFPVRLVYAGLSFALPLVFTWRLLRSAIARRRVGELIPVLPLVLVLQGIWSLGELVGYVTGNPGGA